MDSRLAGEVRIFKLAAMVDEYAFLLAGDYAASFCAARKELQAREMLELLQRGHCRHCLVALPLKTLHGCARTVVRRRAQYCRPGMRCPTCSPELVMGRVTLKHAAAQYTTRQQPCAKQMARIGFWPDAATCSAPSPGARFRRTRRTTCMPWTCTWSACCRSAATSACAMSTWRGCCLRRMGA